MMWFSATPIIRLVLVRRRRKVEPKLVRKSWIDMRLNTTVLVLILVSEAEILLRELVLLRPISRRILWRKRWEPLSLRLNRRRHDLVLSLWWNRLGVTRVSTGVLEPTPAWSAASTTATPVSSTVSVWPPPSSASSSLRASTGDDGRLRRTVGLMGRITSNDGITPFHHGLPCWHFTIGVGVGIIIWNWRWPGWACAIIHIIWTMCVVWIAAERVVVGNSVASP